MSPVNARLKSKVQMPGTWCSLMTPRDIGKAQDLQGIYAPLCNERGGIISDPIIIRHADDRW